MVDQRRLPLAQAAMENQEVLLYLSLPKEISFLQNYSFYMLKPKDRKNLNKILQ